MDENKDLLKALDVIEKNIADVKKDYEANKISQKAFEDELKKFGEEQVKLSKQLQDLSQNIDASKKALEDQQNACKSVGQKAASHDLVKSYQAGTISFDVSTKSDTINTSTAANSISRNTISPAYQGRMVTRPEQPLKIEALFPHVPVSVDAIEYAKEGSVTDGSKVTAEGAKLGETLITKPSLETAKVVNIGAYAIVTHQLITNEAAFAAYIDAKMQYKLQLNVENQLINGNGSSTQLGGLLKNGNYTDKTAEARAGLPKTKATLFDLALLIKAEFEKLFVAPESYIFNPTDWTQLCMIKDEQGHYILGGPQSLATKSLWGVPVETSPFVPSGQYILGNFTLGATIYDREQLNFRVSDQDGENFKSMLYTLRVNRRLGFAVEDPLSIFAGDFSLSASEKSDSK